jgi:hypothetical protein
MLIIPILICTLEEEEGSQSVRILIALHVLHQVCSRRLLFALLDVLNVIIKKFRTLFHSIISRLSRFKLSPLRLLTTQEGVNNRATPLLRPNSSNRVREGHTFVIGLWERIIVERGEKIFKIQNLFSSSIN